MPRLTKLKTAVVLSLTTLFCHPTMAVIVEGSFNGLMWEWQSTNMEGTTDAQFFSEENAFMPFTGEFWYDTELAGPPVFDNEMWSDAEEDATYAGPHNWIHTSLKGYNGAILDLTSSGQSPSFTSSPAEEISVVRYEDHDLIMLSYRDGDSSPANASYRIGSLALEPQNPFVNNLGLIQNYSTNNQNFGPVGYISFETRGVLNGVDYFGWMVAEVSSFNIQVRDPVTVPEPSSLLLFLGPLLFLFWRTGLLKNKPI